MLLGTFFRLEIMCILISLTISDFSHEAGRGIAEMEGDPEIPIFPYIIMHRMHRHIDSIVFWEICEEVGSIQEGELTLGHPHFFTDIVDTIGEDDGLMTPDIFTRKIHHTTGDISRIFSSSEHTSDPVDRRISVTVAERLVHGRDEIIVLLSILVVHEGFTASFEDIFSRECAFSLEDTSGFEEVQSIAEIASSEPGNELN